MTCTNDRQPQTSLPIVEKLLTLAEHTSHFANEFTEVLRFEDYATLNELETKLLAFGNLLEARDRDEFLIREISKAEEHLVWFRQRVSALLD